MALPCGGAAVALGGEGVYVVAADGPPVGDALGALALVYEVLLGEKRGVELLEAAALEVYVAEHRGARHALDAAADRVGYVSRGDRLRGEVNGLLARSAHPVEGDGRDLDGEVREHHRETPDVRALLPGLRYAAGNDVLDRPGLYPGPLYKPAQRVREERVRADLPKGPVPLAEGRPYRLDYYRFAHSAPSSIRSSARLRLDCVSSLTMIWRCTSFAPS